MSRNRVIIEALEANLRSRRNWPPELVRMLETPLDRATRDVLDATLSRVSAKRASRRRPPKL